MGVLYLEIRSLIRLFLSWGGARAGAGRPTNEVKAKIRTVKLTDAEYKAIVAQYGGFAKGVRSLVDK